jgi:phosphotransferase system enzyme I (PtsI)
MDIGIQDSKPEIVLKGIAAAPGIAIGKAYLYSKKTPAVQEQRILETEIESEVVRLQHAISRSEYELKKIIAFAENKLAKHQIEILEAQLLVLHDELLMNVITNRIRLERKNADFIVSDEMGKYQQRMLLTEDEYMRERALDVEDIKARIVRNLQEERWSSKFEGAAIVVSSRLTPADTIIFSRNEVSGYATDFGGATSHAAILSRALKIPAVVGLHEASSKVATGDLIIVDGYGGVLIVHPTPERLEEYQTKRHSVLEFQRSLSELRNLPSETPDGRRVELSANVEFEEELEFLIAQGAAGIGLFRTESLFVAHSEFPGEEEQFLAYHSIVEKMYPRTVTIRTFDVGGDKVLMNSYRESNPFLGWRGIRISLDKPEIFLNQLRAILRASVKKTVKIMFPMIAVVREIRQAKQFLEQAKEQLRQNHIPFDENIKVGIMIEVPSAAVLVEELAKEVDFISIGTNDLIQYLMAVDRGNDIVADLYQQFHPAVLRTVKHIIDGGHKQKVHVAMCGELAGDPLAAPLLLGLELDEFSVIPSLLPEIKKIIRATKFKDAKRIAKDVMTFASEEEVREHLTRGMRERFPEIPLG